MANANPTLKKLSLGHINVNGLNDEARWKRLKKAIRDNDFDIVSVNETKICEEQSGRELEIDGYTTYHRDRDDCVAGTSGGGVALLVKDSIDHITTKVRKSKNVESVWVRIDLETSRLCVGTIYWARTSTAEKDKQYFKDMKDNIKNAVGDDPVILMGDLNIDYLNPNAGDVKLAKKLKDKFKVTQIVGEPTRVESGKKSSLTDVVLTDLPTKHYPDGAEVIKTPKISDHYMVAVDLEKLNKL